MAKHYGVNVRAELSRGHRRKLTRSEIARGYFFVTLATYRREFLDDDDFSLVFDGRTFPHRHLDKYGRAHLGKTFLSQYSPDAPIEILLASRNKVVVKSL